MRIRKKVFDKEIKCPSCNYETSVAFSIDGEDWLCGNCMIDIITEHFELIPAQKANSETQELAKNWAINTILQTFEMVEEDTEITPALLTIATSMVAMAIRYTQESTNMPENEIKKFKELVLSKFPESVEGYLKIHETIKDMMENYN